MELNDNRRTVLVLLGGGSLLAHQWELFIASLSHGYLDKPVGFFGESAGAKLASVAALAFVKDYSIAETAALGNRYLKSVHKNRFDPFNPLDYFDFRSMESRFFDYLKRSLDDHISAEDWQMLRDSGIDLRIIAARYGERDFEPVIFKNPDIGVKQALKSAALLDYHDRETGHRYADGVMVDAVDAIITQVKDRKAERVLILANSRLPDSFDVLPPEQSLDPAVIFNPRRLRQRFDNHSDPLAERDTYLIHTLRKKLGVQGCNVDAIGLEQQAGFGIMNDALYVPRNQELGRERAKRVFSGIGVPAFEAA